MENALLHKDIYNTNLQGEVSELREIMGEIGSMKQGELKLGLWSNGSKSVTNAWHNS